MTATHLHIDPYSGVSGDMMLGALVDLGVVVAELEKGLAALPIGPFRLRAERIKRQGIMGTQVHVEVVEDPHPHRHLRHILEFLDAAGLPSRAAERARLAFTRLAEAEARVHGSTIEKIHFHEVGQKDAVLDVSGAMLALEMLGVESFSVAPIVTGFGTVECAHGAMPVPPPATAELLRGLAHAPGPVEGEMATPTGVAIVAALVGGSAERPLAAVPPTLTAERIGYGAGTKAIEGRANFLRLWLCQPLESRALPIDEQTVVALETEIDDMSPEVAGYLMERLLDDGAFDVQFSPVQMKKNRPALRLRVLCDEARQAALAECIFRETSTFGIRRQAMARWCLARRAESVQTPFGPVAVKVGLWGDRVLKVAPEYEACRALARARGVALQEVFDAARAAIRGRYALDCNA